MNEVEEEYDLSEGSELEKSNNSENIQEIKESIF